MVLPKLDDKASDADLSDGNYDYLLTVEENKVARLNLKLADADKDTVTYTFSPPLDKNGTWKTNYGDAGEYMITLTVTDGKLVSKKKIKLVVKRVNVPPVIREVKNMVAKEGDTITLEPEVTDPNKDPVTVTISAPLKEGAFVTDHTSAGEYQIIVTASDGELESKKAFKLTVRDVNVLPKISGVSDLKVKEGETVTIKPKVTDLDGDEVKLSISEPVGDDGVWETSFTDHGSYTIKITANDGKESIKVTVEDVNKAPEIVDVYLG